MAIIPNSTKDHGSNRTSTRIVYEIGRTQLLVFGGKDVNGSALADTWSQPNAGSWSKLSPTASPAQRFNAAMTYSNDDGYTILFGGMDNDLVKFYSETWYYNGTTWAKFNSMTPFTTEPSQRYGANMVSCDGYSELVLFGGIGTSNINQQELLGDTWLFSTSTKLWSAVNSTNKPTERAHFGMGFDGYNVWMFGGQGTGIFMNDLWKFNALGKQWSQVTTTGTTPSKRMGMACCWDGYNSQLMIFGGKTVNNGLSNETFVINGSNAWTKLTTATHPTRRYNATMAYDSITKKITLFGGTELDGSPLGDVWTFDCATKTWSGAGDFQSGQANGPVSDH